MSDSYEFPSGQYPYPLTKVLTDGGDFSKEFIPGDPTNVIPDVDNFYVICCTPEQMSKIQSSIEVGAPIAFPDFYSDVFQVVDQATQFPNSFEGSPCVDLCELILQCINDTEALQEAIARYAGTSNINGDSTENASNLSSQLVNNPAGCDDDIIFGMTMQLVEFADRLIKDLFEQIAAAQLSSVNLGYLIKLIPVIETLPLDEAFQLVDKLVNDMETAYLSASTSLLKEEIACELFCLAKLNGCVLTLEDVRDYFQVKADVVFDYDDVFSFLVDFINGTFVGNAVYYGMNILFFQIFVFAGKFMEYFYDDYLKTIQAMYNDPNSDWSTLCDDCGWVSVMDFTTDDYGVVFLTASGGQPFGSWVDGVGLVAGNVVHDGQQRKQLLFYKLWDDIEINKYKIDGFYTRGTLNTGLTTAISMDLRLSNSNVAGTNSQSPFSAFSVGATIPIQYEKVGLNVDADEFRGNFISSSGNQTGAVIITRLELRGQGTKPAQLP